MILYRYAHLLLFFDIESKFYNGGPGLVACESYTKSARWINAKKANQIDSNTRPDPVDKILKQ